MDKKMIQVLITMVILLLTTCPAYIHKSTIEQISEGLNSGRGMIKSITSNSSKGGLLFFNEMDDTSGFLGATGALFKFILDSIPKYDSSKVKTLVKAFIDVNSKLDDVTKGFPDFHDFIMSKAKRPIFVTWTSEVSKGLNNITRVVSKMAEVKCKSRKMCRRERMRIAQKYDFYTKHALQGFLITIGNGSVLADELLFDIQKAFKCSAKIIEHSANGLLKLAFKAQQVLLFHQTMLGNSFSIVASINKWLDSVFEIRRQTDRLQNDCYDKILSFMADDAKLARYTRLSDIQQIESAISNKTSYLETKYNWLWWNVFIYSSDDQYSFWISNKETVLTDIQQSPRNRTIVFMAVPQDKGTYLGQRQVISEVMTYIRYNVRFPSHISTDYRQIHQTLENILKQRGVWEYVKAFAVTRAFEQTDSFVQKGHYLSFVSQQLTIRLCEVYESNECYSSIKIRVLILLYSLEEVKLSKGANLTCAQGKKRKLPYSSKVNCLCSKNYFGEKCQRKVDARLALDIEMMFTETSAIRSFADGLRPVADIDVFLGACLGRILCTFNIVQRRLHHSYLELNEILKLKTPWRMIQSKYEKEMKNIVYHLYRLTKKPLNSKCSENFGQFPTMGQIFDRAQKWLYYLNLMIVGRTDLYRLSHKSLMLLMASEYNNKACSKEHKNTMAVTWKMLNVLQIEILSAWIQSRASRGLGTSIIPAFLRNKLKRQEQFMEANFCELDIKSSTNLHCMGGYILDRNWKLRIHCPLNHFMTGPLLVSCDSHKSKCRSCQCNVNGSTSSECEDITGVCKCDRNKYYGKKCRDRDCQWSKWSPWGTCSKPCDYGGTQNRTRSHAITKEGSGKPCHGQNHKTRTCFIGCCSNNFHCRNKHKCIGNKYACNYANDCGDNQDERGCLSCHTRYTGWNSEGGGNMVYFDRHSLNCGAGYLMKKFHLNRNGGGKMRFRYDCCKLTHAICGTHTVHNQKSSDGGGRVYYLDRQRINCGTYGMLSHFHLQRPDKNHVRYVYSCCSVYEQYRSRLTCYSGYTSYTIDGGGKNYYLDRQIVQCRDGYFFNYLHLERKLPNLVRYSFRCCRVKRY